LEKENLAGKNLLFKRVNSTLQRSFFQKNFAFGAVHFNQSVYPLAKIAADFNSATFNSILQNFCEQKFDNFWLKFVD
jgi:hypothetical protein